MTLDPNYSVGVGLFAFRAVVTIALFEPEEGKLEDGGVIESSHYVRSYGVTAESYSSAAEMVEELGGRGPDEVGTQPDGWLDGIELELVDPSGSEEEAEYLAPVEQRGVHFVSGKILYSNGGDEN